MATASVQVLYFAWVRQKTGTAQETLTPPPEVTTVGALVDWIRGRGDNYRAALADMDVVRVAVNQEYVGLDHPVAAGDEIAFFPPVTGG